MSVTLGNLLDLKLGWKRSKRDIERDRVFIKHPYEVHLIEQDLEGWLNKLKTVVQEGNFTPSPAVICEIPKPRSGIRPGSHISMQDRVIYAACVEAAYPLIYEKLEWSQGTIDYNYQLLSPNKKGNSWFKSKFAWKDFNEDTRKKIMSGFDYIVLADICGYYENINIDFLLSEIVNCSLPKEVSSLLLKCLKKWSFQNSSKGIPQGYSASDILGKLYLNYVDYHIHSQGIAHARWVDDFRIFCKSLSEARQIVMLLTSLLRERGLNLQSAKTEICKSDEVLNKINAIEDKLRPLVQNLTNKAKGLVEDEADPYMPMYRVDKVFRAKPEEAPVEAIREAFEVYFMKTLECETFDKSTFRFLLKRLGGIKDKFAVNYCKNIFTAQPQETHTILKYFENVDGYDLVEDEIVSFLSSKNCIYHYQNYQIIEWICRLSIQPSTKLILLVRNFLWGDFKKPLYLRSVCWQFMDKYGSKYDLERAKNSYHLASNQVEQCDIICAINRLDGTSKNDFFRRINMQSDMHSRAVKYANKK